MRFHLWTTTFVAAATLAGTAQAGDVTCLWNRLGEPAREAWFADYDAQGGGALNDGTFAEEDLEGALIGCGVAVETNAATAGEALGGYAIEQAAARWLGSNANLTVTKLETTWEALSPDARDGFTAWVLAIMANADAEAPVPEAALGAMFAALEVTDPQVIEHVAAYYSGRVIRRDREPRF